MKYLPYAILALFSIVFIANIIFVVKQDNENRKLKENH